MRCDLVIRDGHVLTPDGVKETDVAISRGVVAALGGDWDGKEEIDAGGAWVGPAHGI